MARHALYRRCLKKGRAIFDHTGQSIFSLGHKECQVEFCRPIKHIFDAARKIARF